MLWFFSGSDKIKVASFPRPARPGSISHVIPPREKLNDITLLLQCKHCHYCRSYPIHGAYAYPIVPSGMSSGYGSYNPYGTMGSRGAYDAYRHRSEQGSVVDNLDFINKIAMK